MLKNKTIASLIMTALLLSSCQAPAIASWSIALRATCAQWTSFALNTVRAYKRASYALAGLTMCAGIIHLLAYQAKVKRDTLEEDKNNARKAVKVIESSKAARLRSIEDKEAQRATLAKSTYEKQPALNQEKQALAHIFIRQTKTNAAQHKQDALKQLQQQEQQLQDSIRKHEGEIALQHKHNNPENVIDEYEYWRAQNEGPSQAQLDQKYSTK